MFKTNIHKYICDAIFRLHHNCALNVYTYIYNQHKIVNYILF